MKVTIQKETTLAIKNASKRTKNKTKYSHISSFVINKMSAKAVYEKIRK